MNDQSKPEPYQLSITEQMAYCTVRIETDTGTGTGFFYQYPLTDYASIPTIITNKHVVAGTTVGKFLMTCMNADGSPDITNHKEYTFTSFSTQWEGHPDNDIDLCAMPIAPVVKEAERTNTKLFYRTLTADLLPTVAEYEELNPVEDITMVGYPNGLWDRLHNMPIFRRGITATHPKLDWNGKPEFLIDAACFPGSSGSPVFLLNEGGYRTRTGGTHLGRTRVKFLGVLYAGPQQTVEGDIKIVTVPTQNKPIAVSAIPINLGVVIRSAKVDEFGAIFKTRAGVTK